MRSMSGEFFISLYEGFAEGGGGKNRNQHVGLQMKWKNGRENDKESHPALNFEHSQETGNPLLCSVYRKAP